MKRSLSHKRPKRILLERILKRESSQINPETFVMCSFCAGGSDALYQELKRIVDYVEEIKGVDFEPVCVSNSDRIHLELNQNPKDIAMDDLEVGELITYHALDDIDMPYRLSPDNRFVKFGIHVTKNPGFAYTEPYTQE